MGQIVTCSQYIPLKDFIKIVRLLSVAMSINRSKCNMFPIYIDGSAVIKGLFKK